MVFVLVMGRVGETSFWSNLGGGFAAASSCAGWSCVWGVKKRILKLGEIVCVTF